MGTALNVFQLPKNNAIACPGEVPEDVPFIWIFRLAGACNLASLPPKSRQCGDSLAILRGAAARLGYDGDMKKQPRRRRAIAKRDTMLPVVSDLDRRKRLEKLADQLGSFDEVMPLETLLRLRASPPAAD